MLGFSIRLWKTFRDIHTRGKNDPQCDYHILRLKKGCRLRSHQFIPFLRSSLPRPPHPGVPVCRIPLPLPNRHRVDREPGACSRSPSFRGPSWPGISAPVSHSRTEAVAGVLLFLEDELKSRVELSRELGQTGPPLSTSSSPGSRPGPRPGGRPRRRHIAG